MDPTVYKLSRKIAELKYNDLLPFNSCSETNTREFLQKIVDILLDYVELTFNHDEPVLNFHKPNCMKKILDMEIGSEGQVLGKLVEDCAKVLSLQVKNGHPRFMNQLSNGLDIISMAGEWLTATANCNMLTYEISPVFTVMEQVVLKKMREIIGYSEGESIFTPGGAIGNLYAVLLARHKISDQIKSKGMRFLSYKIIIFTSEQSHYSVKSAAAVSGIGSENVITVPTDQYGRMITNELSLLIKYQEKMLNIPMMVVATAGTTVFGSFDNLKEIGKICRDFGVWMHVDAAWGGGIMLSSKYRSPRCDGIEIADSVVWNPHKLMGTTLQCSTFHTRHKGILLECNQMTADYLLMKDKFYDTEYDKGDESIQCGRHNDVFKLWLQWRSRGDVGFERRIDYVMQLTQYLVQKINEQKDKFHLLIEPDFVNVCFWYIPKRLRYLPHSKSKEEEMGAICPKIKERMMKTGKLMVGYTRNLDTPNFFRAVISQEATNEEDIDFMLNEIDRLGEDL